MNQGSQPGNFMLLLLEGFIWFDQQLQEHLSAHDMPTVNRTESMIMLLAGAGLVRPTELAKKLGLARQTINSAIRSLEQKQLIELAQDPADRRCRVIQPAKAGERVYVEATNALQGAEEKLIKTIGQEKIKMLQQTLGECWR